MSWKVTLTNNTDYPHGTVFTTVKEIKKHNRAYYKGQPGNLYWESWQVEGEYPNDLFDVLEPPEIEGSWHPKL